MTTALLEEQVFLCQVANDSNERGAEDGDCPTHTKDVLLGQSLANVAEEIIEILRIPIGLCDAIVDALDSIF